MAEETKEVQCVDWRRCFAFLEILRSFRMAIHPAKIFLCLIGLGASLGIGVLVDQFDAPVGHTNVRIGTTHVLDYLLNTGLLGPEGRTSFYDNVRFTVTKTLWGQWALPYVGGKTWDDFMVFAVTPLSAARDAIALCIAYWREAPLFALINTVLWLAIWALIGGAVTRMSAVRIAREEGVPLKKALGFSFRKWPSIVASPIIPFGVLVFLAILVALPTGLILMIPYAGEVLVGVFWGLTIVMGLLLALVFIGGVFSVGLQWPTIAAEGSDSFDAISRSISYISSRPWRYLFYTGFSAAYGCLTFLFVKFVTFVALWITHTAVGKFNWGEGDVTKLDRLWEMPTLSNPWPQGGALLTAGAESWATYLFQFWVWIALGFMVAFLISFFFTSQTVIYFLLRKNVDATDMEEVYVEESEEEPLPLEHKAEGAQPVKVEGTPEQKAQGSESRET
jgi:hypothetical protein